MIRGTFQTTTYQVYLIYIHTLLQALKRVTCLDNMNNIL